MLAMRNDVPTYILICQRCGGSIQVRKGCTHEIVETASRSFPIAGREVETDVWSRTDINKVKARATNMMVVRFLERTFD